MRTSSAICLLTRPSHFFRTADPPNANYWKTPYLRNTLLVLSSEEDSPGNATGILALKEEGLGLAVLESEDLAIATDVELAL